MLFAGAVRALGLMFVGAMMPPLVLLAGTAGPDARAGELRVRPAPVGPASRLARG